MNPRPEFNQEIEVNSAGELSISEWDTKFSILETRLGDLVAWNFIQTSDVETIEDQVIQLDSSKVLVGQVEFPRISGYDKVFVGIAGTNIVQDITSKTTQFNELNSPIDTVVFEFDGVIGDMPIENYQLFVYWSRTSEDRNVLFRKSSLITPLGIGKR